MIFGWLFYTVPGILSAAIYCRMKNISVKSVDFLVSALIFAFLTDTFVIGIAWLRGHGMNALDYPYRTIGSAVKYAVVSLSAAVALPGIALVLSRFSRGKKHEE